MSKRVVGLAAATHADVEIVPGRRPLPTIEPSWFAIQHESNRRAVRPCIRVRRTRAVRAQHASVPPSRAVGMKAQTFLATFCAPPPVGVANHAQHAVVRDATAMIDRRVARIRVAGNRAVVQRAGAASAGHHRRATPRASSFVAVAVEVIDVEAARVGDQLGRLSGSGRRDIEVGLQRCWP